MDLMIELIPNCKKENIPKTLIYKKTTSTETGFFTDQVEK
jgi:hypothetical protein